MIKDSSARAKNNIHELTRGKEQSSPAIADLEVNEARQASAISKNQPNQTSFTDAEHCPIIVHSHLRWDFVWQRPQQIFSRLARNHRILFIEDPIWEAGESHLQISEPQMNIVRVIPVLSPPDCDVDAQGALILPLLHHALKTHPLIADQFESAMQWFYSPMTAPVMLGQFGAASIIYDCMDELANFRFAPADIAQREQLLLSKADVVFTGGYQLYQSKSRYHTNVHFFGCGVDVEHYGKARDDKTESPKEVASLPRPIFGYFGVIDERLDYELLHELALASPSASIVMVGPLAKVEKHMLPNLPNIHWLGQQSYDNLPALVKSFDVCLMPFALNEATQYINPTKTLEYMAAGKPIVSTAVPDVIRNFTPIVEVANTHIDFIKAAAQSYEAPNTKNIEQGIALANSSTWEEIVKSMRKHLVESVRTNYFLFNNKNN